MIDFNNASYFKLRPVDNKKYFSLLSPMLIDGEQIMGSFAGIRDGVVFTTSRIIAINVQGATGKKKDITCLPYRKV